MGYFSRGDESGWIAALRRCGAAATLEPGRASHSRFRPRILTLVVFFVAAAVIVLANLSYDEADAEGGPNRLHYRSYGWPILWHRLVLSGIKVFGTERAIGWYYSLPRLVANVALWVLLLGTLAGTCEWLLRRYRPRPRWSLRTLLAFIALVAVLSGWYANARNRAAIQDPLIPLQGGYGQPLVFVDRWGPKWFDLLGMDCLRRRIVLASNWSLDFHVPAAEQEFLQLARAPDVRYLMGFHVDELTPTTAKALGSMRQLETLDIELKRLTADLPAALSELSELRSLSISWGEYYSGDDNEARLVDECLAAIGNMPRLETLHLQDLPVRGRSLACLACLKGLKSLDVDFWNGEWRGSRLEEPDAEDCLRDIATLTQLEWLRLQDMRVHKESLACLVGLTSLKTLSLSHLVTDDRRTLSHLPSLPRLEELGLDGLDIEDDDLLRLAALPRLKSLSLGGSSSLGGQALFTSAGLATLGSRDSLEELRLECDIDSPKMIEALGAIRRLKSLHLSDTMYGRHDSEKLMLDDGKELYVDDWYGFRRALAALRQSKPGFVIDGKVMPIFWKYADDVGLSYYQVDAFPERSAAWLPGGDLVWMTPQELADFEQAGGRASFEGATLPDEDKGTGGGIF